MSSNRLGVAEEGAITVHGGDSHSIRGAADPFCGPQMTATITNTTSGGDCGNNHRMAPWLQKWLYRFKTYFLFVHIAYILIIMLASATMIYISERHFPATEVARSNPLAFVDAVFVASSAVSCTGLSTVDVSQWNTFSSAVHNIATILGGMVYTSGAMPLLRLITLRRLRGETDADADDDALLARWKKRKREFIKRLEVTAIISTAVTYGYFVFWHLICVMVLAIAAVNGMSFGDCVQHTIAAFQNCGFVALNDYAGSTTVVVMIGFTNAAGGALYPMLLRLTFAALLRLASLWEAAKSHSMFGGQGRDDGNTMRGVDDEATVEYRGGNGEINGDGGGGRGLLLRQSLLHSGHSGDDQEGDTTRGSIYGAARASFALSSAFDGQLPPSDDAQLNGDGEGELSMADKRRLLLKRRVISQREIWEGHATRHLPKYFKGLLTINHAPDPSLYHFFLFSWHDTLYLTVAFAFINAAQMLPFLVQQWGGDGVLAPFAPIQKVLVALSQSILVRFSGTTLVDVLQFSNVHVLWILFAMYIPVVPIPTDRGRRKWKAMLSAGVMRLLTSRLFLLFLSTSIIVWVEESRLQQEVEGTRFDLTTRVLFETISGYATSGMTLPVTSSVASFSSSFTVWGKLIIAANMLIGRHRWMDMGIDIGLDAFEASEREVRERLVMGAASESVGSASETLQTFTTGSMNAGVGGGGGDADAVVQRRGSIRLREALEA